MSVREFETGKGYVQPVVGVSDVRKTIQGMDPQTPTPQDTERLFCVNETVLMETSDKQTLLYRARCQSNFHACLPDLLRMNDPKAVKK